MGSFTTGIDEGWDDLRDAIEQIYLGQKPLTKSRYMALHTRAKNLCRVKAFRETPRHRVAGYELYEYLKTFRCNHFTTLSNSANGLAMADDILRFYSSEWERFKSSSERLSPILPFRNINSLKNEWPECTERLYTKYQLSLPTWRDVFLHAYGTKVRDGVLDLIENERRGGPVDISLIRSDPPEWLSG
ncbi:cullin-1-like [Haemaphysalis longicornis]